MQGARLVGPQGLGYDEAMREYWHRLRRWLPLVAGALLALLGVGALGLASTGLTITVRPPAAPSAEVDPLVWMREDQAALAEQVHELGAQLEQLVRALEEASVAEEADRARDLTTIERRLDGLEERLSTVAAAGTTTTPTTIPPADEPPPAPPVEAPVETAATPEAAPPAPRGVFSFRANQGLDLGERQRFEVISSLSRVGFDAQSTMHDFSGVTQDVSGWVEARLADPGKDGRGQIVARAATLRTGIDGRDEEMRERLDVEHHPDLRFDWTGFELESLDRATTKLRGHALGTLTVKGVTRPLRIPVNVELDPQRRLVLAGELVVKMSDFGVEPPNLGVIRVKDEVKVWLSLRLRSLGRARDS